MLEAGLCSYFDLFLGAEGVAEQLSEGIWLPCWGLVCVATSICFWAQRGWHSSCLKACGCHFGGWFVATLDLFLGAEGVA